MKIKRSHPGRRANSFDINSPAAKKSPEIIIHTHAGSNVNKAMWKLYM